MCIPQWLQPNLCSCSWIMFYPAPFPPTSPSAYYTLTHSNGSGVTACLKEKQLCSCTSNHDVPSTLHSFSHPCLPLLYTSNTLVKITAFMALFFGSAFCANTTHHHSHRVRVPSTGPPGGSQCGAGADGRQLFEHATLRTSVWQNKARTEVSGIEVSVLRSRTSQRNGAMVQWCTEFSDKGGLAGAEFEAFVLNISQV